MINQLISDLEAIRRALQAAPKDGASAIQRSAIAYILANREVMLHYIGKLYELPTQRLEHAAMEFPVIDSSVINPDFRQVAEHAIDVTASNAWLGVGDLHEDSVHMTIRALRAAAVLVPHPKSLVLFLSPFAAA